MILLIEKLGFKELFAISIVVACVIMVIYLAIKHGKEISEELKKKNRKK